MKFKTYLALCVLTLLCLYGADALAQSHALPVLDAKEQVMDVVKSVLDMVVSFFGAMLDELVRAIKELLGK